MILQSLNFKKQLIVEKVFSIIILLIASITVNAQAPVNDDPCNAIELIAGPICNYQTFSNANATGTTGVPAPGCANYSGGDVWFKVVVPAEAGGNLIFDSQAGVITDGGMAIYRGTCDALTLIECDDDDSNNGLMSFINRTGLTTGDTIWVRFWEYGNDNRGTFAICVKYPPPPPVNDEPCNSTALTAQTTCNYQVFSNESATASAGIPTPGCAGYSGGDVWFNVVVPDGGALVFDTQVGEMLDGGMAIYRGNCGNLTLIECDDNDSPNGLMPYISRTGLTPGDSIFIRVWENGNNGNGSFGICVKVPPAPPLNDDPCTAFDLAVLTDCDYQTFTNESGSASTGIPTPGCANYAGSDVWFQTLVPQSGTIAIDTRAGEMTDGGLAVYAGSCDALTLLACDDNAGNGNMPQLRLDNLVPFSTVLIRVWENGNDNNGTFGICVTEPTAVPVNNDVCNAVIITPTNGCTFQSFSNVNATATVSVPAPTCGNYFGGDVWFQTTIPAGGSLDIDTRSGTIRDAAMAVYSGTSCAGLTQILCDDNSSDNALSPFLNISGQVPGSNIWIRIWGKDSATRVGTFELCVSIPAAQPTTFNFSCTRDTTVGCGVSANCFSLQAVIPNIHASTANYDVNRLNGTFNNCFIPYASPSGQGPSTALTIDDRYSDSPISLPFPFPFFGTNYSQLAASTNGYISFDATLAAPFTFSHYGILNSGAALSATTGTPQNLPSTLYDRALIMGPYHDLDPSNTSLGQKIKYNVVGTAPNRKWVLSTYKTPLFYDAGGCDTLIRNTHQIVLYEGTGIIEVFVLDKQICTGWNQGRSMIGIQNFARNAAVMAPGRRASDAPWGSVGMNESWRFVPSEGLTQFRRVELYDENDVLVATGDTSSINGTTLRVNFDNVCPTSTNSPLRYIVKSFYTSSTDPNVEITGADTIYVRIGTALAANYAVTDADCNGASTGKIIINPSLGTAPYNYSINGGVTTQTSGTFNNVAAGTYNVTIRDAGGCTKDTVITVSEPAKIFGTYSKIDPVCAGATNGNITVAATVGSGIAPYTYAIDLLPYQATGSFAVGAGTYVVHIKDANNCIKDTTIVITEPTAIAGTYQTTRATCSSIDGTITVAAVAGTGTGPYTYAIDAQPFQASGVFTVGAGTYTVRIKDANGCIKDSAITVLRAPTNIAGNYQKTDANCAGATTGTITVVAIEGSGVAPFTYSINNQPFQNSGTFTVGAGTYLVSIKDATDCIKDTTITINEPSAIAGDYQKTNAKCAGSNDGTITVTAIVGTGIAPYTYAINALPYQSTGSFTVAAGTYVVHIKDANGCIKDSTITISEPAPIFGTYTKTDARCAGSLNGTITVAANVGTGTAPYTYAINALPYQSAGSFTVAAGTYVVHIKDANDCIKDTTITISEPAPIFGNYTSTNAKCAGSADATIIVAAIASTGTAPYTYAIDALPYQASGTFTLAAGTYVVHIKDANDCIKDTTITLTEPSALFGTYQKTDVRCAGETNGTITVAANTGTGTAPYTYAIDAQPYQASGSFTVGAGSYVVHIKDANNCIKDTTINITAPNPIYGTYSKTDATCAGTADGTINVTAIAATGTAPFTYAINTSPYQATGTFNVAGGTYLVHIKDANDCIKDTTIIISSPSAIVPNITKTDVSCNGLADGTIIVTAATGSGTAPYTYGIDAQPYQATGSFTLAAGTYVIHIKDANGCIKDSSVTISQPAAISATNATTNVTCGTTANGSITVTPAGGTGPYTFSVDGTNFQTGNSFVSDQGNYTITVKDAKGCTNTFPASVGFTNNLNVDTRPDTSVCDNQPVTLTTNSNAATYSWTNSASLSSATAASPVANPTTTTTYVVTGTLGTCVKTDSVTVSIALPPIVFAGDDVTITKGEDASLVGTLTNAASFTWSPTTYLSNPNSLTTLSVRPQETTTYRLTASNSIGCSAFDEVKVIVTPYCIKVKSAFSPNGDGVNDTWMVYDEYTCLTNVSLTVYNRYGSKVYENRNYRNEWRGTYDGKNLPDATYYYVINFTLTEGRVQQVRGDVTILR
jgi:gliding motility-associated-like protein